MAMLKRNLPIALILIALLFNTALGHAEDAPRDGNWWNQQRNSFKIAFLIGFTEGQAYEDQRWSEAIIGAMRGTAGQCTDSQRWAPETIVAKENEKEFGNVTINQLEDGLDKIYSDYRNRRIRISSAVLLVVRSMDGTPDTELNGDIEVQRKAAAGS